MRFYKTGLKVIGVVAAVSLLAACQTAPEPTPPPAAEPPVEAAPTGPTPGSQEDLVINVGDRVFFAYDKYDLDAEARSALEGQAAWLKKYPTRILSIEGHCDERGTREYNLALGERRANAVKNYLVALGVDSSRVSTISYGKERPVALGSNESAWTQNRRGVTVVR